MGGCLPFRVVSPRCMKKDSRNTVYIVNMERGPNRLVQFWCTNRKTVELIAQTTVDEEMEGGLLAVVVRDIPITRYLHPDYI